MYYTVFFSIYTVEECYWPNVFIYLFITDDFLVIKQTSKKTQTMQTRISSQTSTERIKTGSQTKSAIIISNKCTAHKISK